MDHVLLNERDHKKIDNKSLQLGAARLEPLNSSTSLSKSRGSNLAATSCNYRSTDNQIKWIMISLRYDSVYHLSHKLKSHTPCLLRHVSQWSRVTCRQLARQRTGADWECGYLCIYTVSILYPHWRRTAEISCKLSIILPRTRAHCSLQQHAAQCWQ